MSSGILHLNPPPSIVPGEWMGYMTLGAIKTRRKDLKEMKDRFRRGLWGEAGVRAENKWEAEIFGVRWDGGVKKEKTERAPVVWEGDGEGGVWEAGAQVVEGEGEEFKWVVDRVSIVRRERDEEGGEGHMHVVGEIMLKGGDEKPAISEVQTPEAP